MNMNNKLFTFDQNGTLTLLGDCHIEDIDYSQASLSDFSEKLHQLSDGDNIS